MKFRYQYGMNGHLLDVTQVFPLHWEQNGLQSTQKTTLCRSTQLVSGQSRLQEHSHALGCIESAIRGICALEVRVEIAHTHVICSLESLHVL